MRVMTVFGTRPEIIRLSLLLKILDRQCDHIMIHTGQNYHESLSDIFIRDLGVRPPDVNLGIRANGFADQAAQILKGVDEAIVEHRPDKVVILGDTNSALSAIVCARRGIPVFHMEAGNRCYDDRVPEEVNRRIIDHASTILLPYTDRSKENLVDEGVSRDRIYVTGNPIFEVLEFYAASIEGSGILSSLNVAEQGYFLATVHRAENVDSPGRLKSIFQGLASVVAKHNKEILVSVHPRTEARLREFNVVADPRIRLLEPLGFFDFVKLEKNAFCVLTDSGTVQEECAIFRVPNVTIRDVTERPETLECGSNVVSGADSESISRSVDLAVSLGSEWSAPTEYFQANTSKVVAKIVLGYTSIRRHQ